MSERSALEAVFWKALLVAGLLVILWLSRGFVVMALLALILATALMPIVDAAAKRRWPRVVTVALIYLFGVGFVVLFVALLVPVVIEQGHLIVQRLPQYRQRVMGWLEVARSFAWRWSGAPIEIPELTPEQVVTVMRDLVTRSFAATRGVFAGAFAAFLTLFMSAYIVVDRERLARGAISYLPPRRQREAQRVGAAVSARMGGYVRGQAAVSACIAILLSIGLAIIGIDAPLVIGVTAGAFNLVPYLGSFVALLLALLIAVNQSSVAVIGVLALFGGVQFLEGYVFSPYFLGRNVDLHPLAILAALIIGASVGGLVGVVLAVPILAGIDALVQEVYVRPMKE